MPIELAAAGRRQRVRRVLDHAQAVAAGDVEDRRHVGGQAAVVHRDRSPCVFGRDRRLDRVRVDAERRRVDVDQLHVGAEVAHDLGGGGEGVGRRDHLVARADAERLEREVQAGGRRVDGERLQRRVAEEGAEVVLEALGLRAGGEPAGTQRVDDLGDLVVADLGRAKGRKGRLIAMAAVAGPSTSRCFALAPGTASMRNACDRASPGGRLSRQRAPADTRR